MGYLYIMFLGTEHGKEIWTMKIKFCKKKFAKFVWVKSVLRKPNVAMIPLNSPGVISCW